MSVELGVLKQAIVERLAGDGELAGLLGGAEIYDHPPPRASFPYVTFGRASVFDYSTVTERASEIILSLDVWSRARGSIQALAIAGRIGTLLNEAENGLEPHRLVDLRLAHVEAAYQEDAGVHRATLTFRAVIEPAQ